MDAGRREGKAEGSQVELSLRKIADANDEVVDAAGHEILRMLPNRNLTRGINAGQSIVTGAKLKKIYCWATAYP
jgi:hypothetical protein